MNPNNNGEANQQALVPLNVDYIGSMMSSKREVSSQSILILNSSFVGVPVPPVRMPSLRRQVRSHVDIPSPRPDEQQQDQDQNRKCAGLPCTSVQRFEHLVDVGMGCVVSSGSTGATNRASWTREASSGLCFNSDLHTSWSTLHHMGWSKSPGAKPAHYEFPRQDSNDGSWNCRNSEKVKFCVRL